MVKDPNATVLFVEDSSSGAGMGMLVINWSGPAETYWEMLRVAASVRRRGIASLLFEVGARLVVERQGASAVGRWGIVSNNETMIEWSKKLKMHGPQRFRRHTAKPCAEPPTLPAGYTFRAATESDVPTILSRLASFPVASSPFGSQNFVITGWAEYSEAILRSQLSGAIRREFPMPTPRVLFDEAGELIAFGAFAKHRFGQIIGLLPQYTDGTPAGFELYVRCLPYVAHELGCDRVGGYVPTLPWILEVFERSPDFERATATEQCEFHWRCADYVRSPSWLA